MRKLAIFLLGTLLAGAAEKPEQEITERDRSHWSFRAPVRVPPPAVNQPELSANPIDRFLLVRLEKEGLSFAPEAERAALLRRASFVLTGLPPSPEEMADFLSDDSPNAWERVVDRLLASPGLGVRWAQHWLDVARFAESDGFEHDIIRPEAWRFRDWVIGALNADLPYDRFVQLQLAADELAPGDEEALIATGFLMAGPDMPDMNVSEERRHHFLNGMVATVGGAFMGLTLGCAQCHDHKTDPVSIGDFYRLRAVFAGTVVNPQRDRAFGTVVKETAGETPPSYVMTRGDYRRPAEVATPAFLRVLNPAKELIPPPPPGSVSSLRRATFARWLTRADHPLTSRVAVNHLWQHHFGRGLVESAGDFGKTGEKPTHPDLLDWLAVELPAQDWSLKYLHRLILTSRAWRQASRGVERNSLAVDPDNRLLSRQSRRRLDGETIRDAFLAWSGLIQRDVGGPGVRPPLPAEVTANFLKKQWEVTPDPRAAYRRSVFLFARRNLRFPLFEVFDRPEGNASCARRPHSTTAPQSLALLNSEFSFQIAQAIAQRLAATQSDSTQRIKAVHHLLFARPPSQEDLAKALAFLEAAHGDPDALTHYCLALLNANETIYVD